MTEAKCSRSGKSRKGASRSKQRKALKVPNVRVPWDYPWVLLGLLIEDLSRYVSFPFLDTLKQIVRSRSVSDYLDWSDSASLQSICAEFNLPPLEMKVRLLLGAVIRKFPFKGPKLEWGDTDRVNAAIAGVKAGEDSCSRFNQRGWRSLFKFGKTNRQPELGPEMKSSASYQGCVELYHMQQFVHEVLGPVLDLDKLQRSCRHGPGATTGTSKGKVSQYFKYADWPYDVTAKASVYAKRLILSDERWIGALQDSYRAACGYRKDTPICMEQFWTSVLREVKGNRITTVPKDYRKDRPIAIEPTLNLMLQLGVDGYVRKRMKRWGIDIDNQFPNQEAARLGSLDVSSDTPVTIDLSNASDTISLRLIEQLFSREWFEYLCALRSPVGTLPGGERLRYSKLSSMGNGATFAIETLVFAAAAYASAMVVYGRFPRGKIVVFGDDIVVPQDLSGHLIRLLGLCGFTVNRDKTFLEGPVRESCGTDWVRGRNVRPVYLKRYPRGVWDLIAYRNLVHRWCCQHLGLESNALTTPATDAKILSWIPEAFQLWGPCSDEEYCGYLHTGEPGSFQDQSYRFRSLVLRARKLRGQDFLFRKLMVSLRKSNRQLWRSLEDQITAESHAFDVLSRGEVRLGITKRRTPVWGDAYSAPDDPRRAKRSSSPRG